jgi:hypothetical protein
MICILNFKRQCQEEINKTLCSLWIFQYRRKVYLTERGCRFEKVRINWKSVVWWLELDTRDVSHLQSVQNWWTLHTSLCVRSHPFKSQTRRSFKTCNFAVNLIEEVAVYVRTVNLQWVTPTGIKRQRKTNTNQIYI